LEEDTGLDETADVATAGSGAFCAATTAQPVANTPTATAPIKISPRIPYPPYVHNLLVALLCLLLTADAAPRFTALDIGDRSKQARVTHELTHFKHSVGFPHCVPIPRMLTLELIVFRLLLSE
jgi:hypothetical protein